MSGFQCGTLVNYPRVPHGMWRTDCFFMNVLYGNNIYSDFLVANLKGT